MDWKSSLDTTFSDIWKGRNLNRLLLLWLSSLATLALYGTTTASLPLPKIPTNSEVSRPPKSQKAITTTSPDAPPDLTEGMQLAKHLALKTITEVTDACSRGPFGKLATERRMVWPIINPREIIEAVASSRLWRLVSNGSVVDGGLDEEAGG